MFSSGFGVGPQEMLLLFLLPMVVIWLAALVDVVRRPFKDSATKLIWVVVVLFGQFLGAILYFAFGRREARPNVP